MPRIHTTWRWAAWASAVALCGCASLRVETTDPSAGVAVPQTWQAPSAASATDAASLSSWWQRFGDPALSRLVEDAIAANTDVAAATAALRQARAMAVVQQARLGPTIGASASVQRSHSDGAGSSTLYRAGFDASWEPDVFGGQRAATNAADYDVISSAANLGNVQISIAAEVALDYIALRSAERRLAIARDNLASQQETLQITDWRVQAGLATSLDAEQARTVVEQTLAQIPALQASITLSSQQLALLTGRTTAQLTVPAGSAVPMPANDIALAFPAETLRQRPDVRAAEAQVSAAAERVVQADAARYPSFNLSGTLGLSSLTIAGLSGGGALASSLLAGLSVPLFDGGALAAQADAQRAALDQARAGHRGVVLAALKDVEDALVTLQGDRARLLHLQAAAEAADNAALLARQRYSSGLVDFLTVLITQRAQLTAQDSVAAANADVAFDHVRLFKALGGGWTPLPATTGSNT